ncbi:type IX secretion system outer membrane channel protein PorV [Flavobacterium azooxidireducens]|uniref:Type IX secretion system outer membrane channel protein PorV n=1 Tax=Flavobacterium azooxidireducens TaxID=1871076 RepID=A0ABY4KGA8_9FLAO|nr:type IX secretion system outer membrane channel protein PorV [Flavobacterium azooxidireducens]UPQ79835.1 type IX secretion system outer membrane channel protein PorV [Flavobacterium azooxidireducens]
MKKITVFLICLFAFQNNFAQDRVITTGVPFLLIAADARAAGMADIGVATSPDAYSQQWNPAKYAFATEKIGIGVSYTPYLTDLVNDISLGQLNYYNRISEKSAFGGSLRYFSLGDIELRENFDDVARVVSPNELAVDVSYALKLSERFSTSVAFRYIRSQLRIPDGATDAKPASSFAFDLSGYYQSEEEAYDSFNGRWRAGFNFQNLGPKINYDEDVTELNSNFLPANMRLGGGFDFIFDEYNKIGLNAEVTKLLVPTPQNPDLNGDGEITNEERIQARDDYQRIGWVSGIFQSFGDAPDGFSEELREFTWALGAEYNYQDSFALRLGYFNEHETKGARKYFSFGAGFKYTVIKLDVSYLFSASKVKNPLENTLRFSLTFNFGDKYDEY